MTRSTTKRLALSLALATLTAAMLGGSGAVAATPAQTFRGVCNVEGTRAITTYSFGSGRERTVARGSCLGSVNGGPILSHPVRLVTTTTVSLVDVGTRGSGWIKFKGYKRRLNFKFKRIAARALLISGSAGSQATAALHRRAAHREMIVLQATSLLRGL